MNDRQPINIPQVPDDATLPQINDELEEVNRKLLRKLLQCKDDQIKQLTEIVNIQRQMITKLKEQINTLLYGGGCGGGCSTGGRMD